MIFRLGLVLCFIALLVLGVHGLIVLADSRFEEEKLIVRLLPHRSEAEDDSGYEEYSICLEVLHPRWAEFEADAESTLTVEVFSGIVAVSPDDIGLLPCVVPRVSVFDSALSALPRSLGGELPGVKLPVLAGYKDCREARAITVTVVLSSRGRRTAGVTDAVRF